LIVFFHEGLPAIAMMTGSRFFVIPLNWLRLSLCTVGIGCAFPCGWRQPSNKNLKSPEELKASFLLRSF
jgi:hypothetical protein